MLGVNHICKKCKGGGNYPVNGIDMKDINKGNALLKFKCSKCGQENTIEESFIEYIISNNIFSINNLIYEKNFSDSTYVTIGETTTVRLITPISRIEEIIITPYDEFQVSAIYLPRYICGAPISEFDIVSSLRKESVANSQVKQKVDFIIYSSEDYEEALWFKFVKQAKTALKQNNFSIAILCSEIAFESFVDMVLRDLLKRKNINRASANIIIESMKSIYDKVHKLLNELGDINIKKNKNLNKNWIGLLEERNRIAHGDKIIHTKEDAYKFFTTAIEAIFFINRESSNDYIYNNYDE